MSRFARMIVIAAFLGVLAVPTHAVAQAPSRYTLVDLGTFGGPNTYWNTPGNMVSNSGVVVGSSDTTALSPYPQECTGTDCHAGPGFTWQKGVMTNLGTLPGGYDSAPFEMNGSGVVVGMSDNGTLDPLTNFPEAHAVIWQNGHIVDLGAFGGNESWATAIDGQGQVAGFATNTVPDPYTQFLCAFPCATQVRAFVWQNGVMQNLGTLGGPDSAASLMNEQGQVAGVSYINSTPNATTGAPTLDPFLWENGTMHDLGNLGGTLGFVNWLNARGQVAGQSLVAGDGGFHPFLWSGGKMIDLGTLGGNYGNANWINDAGQVVGAADVTGSQTHHGFLWQNGRMTDLVPVGAAPCSNAFGINASAQVVGNITDCNNHGLGAMLWQNGAAYDLNTLIAPTSMHLREAQYINDVGEIVAAAVLPNGNLHTVLLVPSGLAASEGLKSNAPAPLAVGSPTTVVSSPARDELGPVQQDWRLRGYHLPGK